MTEPFPPQDGRPVPGTDPDDDVRVLSRARTVEDLVDDDIEDAELVDVDVLEAEVVALVDPGGPAARADHDDVIDAAAVAEDRGRAERDLAATLEEDVEVVARLDDDGDVEEGLEITGEMVPVTAAASALARTSDAGALDVADGAPGSAGSPSEEVEVECPGCGLSVVGFDPRPTAAWFCPRCDYPLFLVRAAAEPEPEAAKRGARRRLPGTAGRSLTAAAACWNCGEWNEAGVTACLRCAATLPRPEAPRVPAEVIPPELEPELVEVEVLYWPPVVISVLGGFGAGMVFLWAVLVGLGRL